MKLHHRPLFPFAVAFVLGILFAAETGAHPLTAIGASVLLGVVCWVFPFRALPRPVILVLVAVFLTASLRTALLRQVPDDDISQLANGQKVHVTGVVASDPEFLNGRTRFVVRSEQVRNYVGTYRVSGRTMVTVYHTGSETSSVRLPSYGDRVRIHGRLRRPSSATNPGASDYGEYLSRRRVYCTQSATMDGVSVLVPGPMTVRGLASRFRAGLTSKSLALFHPVHARLLLGILLGEYAALPTEIQSAFMRSGTMHLLAASGYNCGVIIGIFGYLMRRLTVPRTVMHWLLIALLWGFTLVAGAGPSIVRAALMVSAFLAAYLLYRAADLINLVLAAGIAILAVNPLSLYDIGFQLSFAAVLSIILGMPLVEPRDGFLSFQPRLTGRRASPIGWVLSGARTITYAVILSVVAALATWPIIAYYFNYVSLVNVAANALVALLVVILTAVGIGVLSAAAILPWLGSVLAPLVDSVAGMMLGIVSFLGSQTWSAVSMRSPPTWFLLTYYAVLLGILEYGHRKIAKTQELDSSGGTVPSDGADLAASPKP